MSAQSQEGNPATAATIDSGFPQYPVVTARAVSHADNFAIVKTHLAALKAHDATIKARKATIKALEAQFASARAASLDAALAIVTTYPAILTAHTATIKALKALFASDRAASLDAAPATDPATDPAPITNADLITILEAQLAEANANLAAQRTKLESFNVAKFEESFMTLSDPATAPVTAPATALVTAPATPRSRVPVTALVPAPATALVTRAPRNSRNHRNTVPCKFEDKCRRSRSDCPFFHPEHVPVPVPAPAVPLANTPLPAPVTVPVHPPATRSPCFRAPPQP